MRGAATFLLLALLATGPARADDDGYVLAGPDGRESMVGAADLLALPSHRAQVTFLAGDHEESADYAGAKLFDALPVTVLVGSVRDRAHLVVRVTGRDGYSAAVAVGEIDPELEGKDVLLGHRLDAAGKPVGGLRLIVPGDRHGARNVKDVARVEVR